MIKRSLLAKRMEQIPFQAIRSVGEEVARLEKQGKHVIHMEIGRPDFDTPAHIKQAAKDALDQGLVHYTSNYGIPELREAIADKLRADNNLAVDPVTEVIVTVGTIEAILIALLATLDPGDEILIPDPAWTSYQHCIRMIEANPVSIPLREENGFKPSIEDLEAHLTPRTKAMLISSPHNPTGVVLSKGELEQLADFARQKDLLVLSDEIYEKLVYDEAKHYSIGSFPGMKERTITINGFSKAYSMTGWRLGYVAASKELINAMIRVHQYCTVCATSFAQKGAVQALRGPQEPMYAMIKEFDRRRLMVLDYLSQIPEVTCIRPQGAFYMFPSIKNFGVPSADLAKYLLYEANVALTAGVFFGQYGEDYIRISYANSYENMELGMQRMVEALKKFKKR